MIRFKYICLINHSNKSNIQLHTAFATKHTNNMRQESNEHDYLI